MQTKFDGANQIPWGGICSVGKKQNDEISLVRCDVSRARSDRRVLELELYSAPRNGLCSRKKLTASFTRPFPAEIDQGIQGEQKTLSYT